MMTLEIIFLSLGLVAGGNFFFALHKYRLIRARKKYEERIRLLEDVSHLVDQKLAMRQRDEAEMHSLLQGKRN